MSSNFLGIGKPSMILVMCFIVGMCTQAVQTSPYYKGNLAVSMGTEGETLLLQVYSRGRFGSTILSMSGKNGSKLYFHSLDASLHISSSLTPPILFNDTQGLIKISGNSHSHLSEAYNDIRFTVVFNASLFFVAFPDQMVIITLGFTYTTKSLSDPFYGLDEKLVLQFNYSSTPFIALEAYANQPRAELASLPAFVVMLCFYIVVGGLCLLFRDQQPLKSRGIIPVVYFVMQFSYLFLGIIPWFISIENRIICFYLVLLIYFPIQFSMLAAYLLNITRYLTILHLNKQKNLSVMSKKNQKMKWYFLVLKMFGKPWIQLLTLVSMFFLMELWFLITLAIFQFRPTIATLTLAFTPVTVIIITWAVACFVYDFILNFTKIIRCKFVEMFFDDKFYFKIEFFGLGLSALLPVYIIAEILGQVQVIRLDQYWIFTSVVFFLLFAPAWFPLLVTIIRVGLSNYFTPETANQKDKLLDILRNEKGRASFHRFASGEFSLENLSCWNDLQKFKLAPSSDMLRYIFEMYLNGSVSQLEVNIPQSVCQQVKKIIDLGEITYESSIAEVEKAIIGNLCDTYSRYIFSIDYRRYLATSKYFDEELK